MQKEIYMCLYSIPLTTILRSQFDIFISKTNKNSFLPDAFYLL